MNEQSSKQHTPKKNKSTRPLSDPTNGIQQAEENSRPRHRNEGQPEHRARGPSWYNPLKLGVTFLNLIITSAISLAGLLVIFGQWQVDQVDTIATWQKERARVVLSDMQIEPVSDPELFFSLIFKNVGETTALNTYGAWLQGECQRTSSQECIDWCLQPLRETQGKSYGLLDSQDKHTEEFSYTLKIGKARKRQRPVYFCGYFAYTDVFCVWRRQFYVLSYNLPTRELSTHALTNHEEQARAQNCSP